VIGRNASIDLNFGWVGIIGNYTEKSWASCADYKTIHFVPLQIPMTGQDVSANKFASTQVHIALLL
jgi:hypothetical protein